nr:reverse transcriptase domain-containing protein [Tanacetum cinerariifolium]
MDQMLKRLAGNEYYCFLDGFSGYFQIPIDPQDQENTIFLCPYGTFTYRRMPFGLCNAPGTFQTCMMVFLHDMIEKTMEVFMNDFSVFGNSFRTCLSHLEKMLKRCEDTNLFLNWEKSHSMVKEGIVLGHKISKNGIEVDKAKVYVIAKLPHPTTVKGIHSFLGHAGFYHGFIYDFSKIARLMTRLLEKDTPFFFSKECIEAFQTLKKKFTEALILVAPDWDLPFELMCDASDFSIGVVLGKQKTKHFQPIHYASKTMTDAQAHYTTTEKELLAVVIQQYLQHEHYALWEVTEFKDSYEVPASAATTGTSNDKTGKKKGRTVTVTADDMQKRKNDQYGNFKAEGSETLEQTFNRLHVDHDSSRRKDDEQSGRTVTIITEDMQRKKNDVKTRTTLLLSLPDEHQLSNEDGNTACVTTASTAFLTGSVNVVTISQDTASAYVASQSNGFDKSKVECFNCHKMGHFVKECRAPRSQERGRKESYRQGSKAEEKSPKALMAIDGVGWDWSYMENEKDHALVADGEAPTKFALMANTKSKVFNNSLCLNECKKNTDSLNSKIKDLKSELSEANNYIYHYKLAVAQLKGRLTEYKERKVKYIEKIKTLEMYRSSNLKSIKALDKQLKEVKLEKDGLDGKLAGLLKASKNLDHLIESQRSDQVKEGVGYNAGPPPAADLYLSPKKDLSWTGLPEFVDDTVTDYSRPLPTVANLSWTGLPEFTDDTVTDYSRPLPTVARERPHGGFMRPSYRPAGHRPHGPAMNPRRPTMNGARPYKSFFKQAHSYETKPLLKSSAVRNQYRAPWVPTVNRINPLVSRKFSIGRRNFPTVTRKFPTASKKFTTGSIKITLLIWEGEEKL